MIPTNTEDMAPATTRSHNTHRGWKVRGILSKKEASALFHRGHRIKVMSLDPYLKIFAVCHRSEATTLHDAILRKKLFNAWSRQNTVRAQLRYYDRGYWDGKHTKRARQTEE